MKKPLFLFILILGLTGCQKLKDLASVNFNFDNDTVEFTIPASGSAMNFTKSETFTMNLDSLIKANNAELAANHIKSLTINSINLTLINGDADNNFGNIESAAFSFYSNVNTTPIQIGALSNNPATEAYTLSIPISQSVDVQNYAKNATTFNYSFSGTLRKVTNKELKCKAKVNYKITAGL